MDDRRSEQVIDWASQHQPDDWHADDPPHAQRDGRVPAYDPHGGQDPWKDLPPPEAFDTQQQPPMEDGLGVHELEYPMPFGADHGLEPLGEAPKSATLDPALGSGMYNRDQVGRTRM